MHGVIPDADTSVAIFGNISQNLVIGLLCCYNFVDLYLATIEEAVERIGILLQDELQFIETDFIEIA